MPIIAIFESARNVIRAEKICREHGLQVKVMPLPEQFSSECGMCLHLSEKQPILQLMSQANINVTMHDHES